MYDSVYQRKQPAKLLDLLDSASIEDDEIAALQCTGFLAKGDLTHYRDTLATHTPIAVYGLSTKPLLDLGCGLGGFGRWLACALQRPLVGIDFSPVAIAQACTSVSDPVGCSLSFEVAEFTATGLDDESIAAAVSLDALYLAINPLAALAEARRVLVLNGPLLFTVYTESHQSQQSIDSVPPWVAWLDKSGFRMIHCKDVTDPWRTHMRKKHEFRWQQRAWILRRLGHAADPELAVSAAMLGFGGKPAFIDSVSRFELLAARR
jgi:ubiquinone/menaquinone biosynthesis C-methylase UbiE